MQRDHCTANQLIQLFVDVNVNNFLAISEQDFDGSGTPPGTTSQGVNYLEIPLRQQHLTHRTICFGTRGVGKRDRARDLQKKGSELILSSNHWTRMWPVYGAILYGPKQKKNKTDRTL